MTDMSLVQYLQWKIAEYVDGRRYQSLMTLSDRSGVPYNTIRRISNGQVEKPNFETVLAILKVVESRQKALTTVRNYYPELADFLSESEPSTPENPSRAQQKVFDSLIDDGISYRIYCLASTRCGTSTEQIERLLGEEGLGKLQILMDGGLLYLDNLGMIRSIGAGPGSAFAKSMLQRIKYGLEFFDPSLLGTDGGHLAIECDSVNLQGIRAIKKACKDFSVTIARITNDERMTGSIPFYTNFVFGLLDASRLPRRSSSAIHDEPSTSRPPEVASQENPT